MPGATKFRCRECFKEHPLTFQYVCDECFGPLDIIYDTSAIHRETFASREMTYWRYAELLPIQDRRHIVSLEAGMTPLIKAERLGRELGLNKLYIKNDSVNPTFSFKDRPAGVAVSKARELGLSAVGCASTGNLAASTAAHAAKAGLPCYVFVPKGLERAKMTQTETYGTIMKVVDGTYDDANRVAARAGDRRGIGIVNINLRPYYVEGSKTLAFEVAEQLGWNIPDHLVIPVGSGAMLNAICRGFEQMDEAELTGDCSAIHPHAAQPRGCSPVVDAFSTNTMIEPVKHPATIATSLAIGEPGDGRYVLDRLRQYGGSATKHSDEKIRNAIGLLAQTEGIFTEPAGGVAVAALTEMADCGTIGRDDLVVCYVTGNGLKAIESIQPTIPQVAAG